MTAAGALFRRHLHDLWAVVLTLLLLGPALGAGYVLSYDMVWVPDLALRPDFLGLGTGLPRAVPSDAVVAVLDEIVPGMLLQKVVLLGALVGAGAGVARLVPPGRGATLARVVAVSGAVWSPFVVERLVIGHWPVLVGYGVLPWVVLAARRWRTDGVLPWSLLVLLPLGSLSVSAGLATAVALLAFAAVSEVRRWLVLGGLLLAANAPWLVAGLLHAGDALSTRAAVEAFALHGEGSLPAPLAALTLGGIWNAEVVPSSRTGFQAWVAVGLVVALAAIGARSWWRAQDRRDAVAFLVCWVVGTTVPILTWLVPGLVGAVVAHVPGAGVLRDGSRTLALAAPVVALVVAQGARTVWVRMAGLSLLRVAAGLTLVLFPLALMPDAGWGVSDRLRAVDFPDEYAEVRSVVAQAHESDGGDVVLLPFASYRQPSWLDGRKVLDPTGRYLTPDYVAADELVVSGVVIAGEDPRAREVAAALDLPSPEQRAAGLAGLGIGYVVHDRDTPGEQPDVAGTTLHDGPLFEVVALSDVDERGTDRTALLALTAAWTAYVAIVLGAVVLAARRWRRRRSSAAGENMFS